MFKIMTLLAFLATLFKPGHGIKVTLKPASGGCSAELKGDSGCVRLLVQNNGKIVRRSSQLWSNFQSSYSYHFSSQLWLRIPKGPIHLIEFEAVKFVTFAGEEGTNTFHVWSEGNYGTAYFLKVDKASIQVR